MSPPTADGVSAIDARRIGRDIEAIASFSESPPEIGFSRPTFSAPWRSARDYVIAQAEEAGCNHVVDAAGNVHIRHATVGWERKTWLSGSHIDSVPSGGKYDGVMGIVIPLEILRAMPELPLELIVFAEEEGTTFGLGMLGSRGWAGVLGPRALGALVNKQGRTYLEAGSEHGVDADRLSEGGHWASRLDPSRYVALVEVHAEQGLGLWDAGGTIAAVERINGRRQLEITITGQANHAGSTGMTGRRDALAGASALVVALEALGQRLDRELPHTVLTVGSLAIEPNAVNVIPGRARLQVDFRAQDEALLERGEAEIRRLVAETAAARRLAEQTTRSEQIEPRPLDESICAALQSSAVRLGSQIPVVPSGALHDAAVLSSFLPTAMMFVASRDGISHNPAEYSRLEDITLAARTLAETIASFPDGVGTGAESNDP